MTSRINNPRLYISLSHSDLIAMVRSLKKAAEIRLREVNSHICSPHIRYDGTGAKTSPNHSHIYIQKTDKNMQTLCARARGSMPVENQDAFSLMRKIDI